MLPSTKMEEKMRGLITENVANMYKVEIENRTYEAVARGKLKQDQISPVVGDFVEVELLDEEKKQVAINKICNRKNYVKRPKIANLDKIILVVSSVNPKPDILMLDKQLAFAEYMDIDPIIVFNKIDLDTTKQYEQIKEDYEKIGYKVINTNAKLGIGTEELTSLMSNAKCAFSGNSGVGKSTLINSIFKENKTDEGEISIKNKKGKNTTTIIKLYKIDNNTYIADTPGFSTFDIFEIESSELATYFKEFEDLVSECKYTDCEHIKEEDCGIKKALEENKINPKRYERYKKIYLELKEKESRKW